MKIIQFFTKDIWSSGNKENSNIRIHTIRQLKVIIVAWRGFRNNRCYLRASALTYYTVLSLVPILALIFGISKGFGLEDKLEDLIYTKFAGHEAVINKLVTFSDNLLGRTSGGLIAGIGVIILLWSVIRLMCNVEHSFNSIWGIKKQRTIFRQLTDYLSTALICPILLIISGSLTAKIAAKVASINYIPSTVDILFSSLIPYVMIWIVFAFIYLFIPNCRVKHTAAIIPGIIAGTIFSFTQWAYVNFQIGVTQYNAIYGSFAALPLFLVWVQISWVVVLFGAEISFAFQNINEHEYDENISNISHNQKKLLALRVCNLIIKRYCDCQKPCSLTDIARELQVSARLSKELVYELLEAGIISEIVSANGSENCFQPAYDPHKMTVYSVLEALNMSRERAIHFLKSSEVDELNSCLSGFQKLVKESSSNKLLKDI